jgi:hypothetical protein
MKFKRKIAATLAGVMAFGAVAAFNPMAVSAYQGNNSTVWGNTVMNYDTNTFLIDNQIQAQVGNGADGVGAQWIVNTTPGFTANVAHGGLGRDILIPAHLLNVAGTLQPDGSRAIDFTLDGPAEWNFNRTQLRNQGNGEVIPGGHAAIELADFLNVANSRGVVGFHRGSDNFPRLALEYTSQVDFNFPAGIFRAFNNFTGTNRFVHRNGNPGGGDTEQIALESRSIAGTEVIVGSWSRARAATNVEWPGAAEGFGWVNNNLEIGMPNGDENGPDPDPDVPVVPGLYFMHITSEGLLHVPDRVVEHYVANVRALTANEALVFLHPNPEIGSAVFTSAEEGGDHTFYVGIINLGAATATITNVVEMSFLMSDAGADYTIIGAGPTAAANALIARPFRVGGVIAEVNIAHRQFGRNTFSAPLDLSARQTGATVTTGATYSVIQPTTQTGGTAAAGNANFDGTGGGRLNGFYNVQSLTNQGTFYHTGTIGPRPGEAGGGPVAANAIPGAFANQASVTTRDGSRQAIHGGFEIPFRVDYNSDFRANTIRVSWYAQDARLNPDGQHVATNLINGAHLRVPVAVRFTGNGEVRLFSNPGLTGVGGSGNPTILATQTGGINTVIQPVAATAVNTGRLQVDLPRLEFRTFNPEGIWTTPVGSTTARGFSIEAPEGYMWQSNVTIQLPMYNIVMTGNRASTNLADPLNVTVFPSFAASPGNGVVVPAMGELNVQHGTTTIHHPATSDVGIVGNPVVQTMVAPDQTFAYLSHNGTILNIVWGRVDVGTRAFNNIVRVDGLRLSQRDMTNPIFRNNLSITIRNGFTSHDPTLGQVTASNGFRGLSGPLTPVVANFADWGINFTGTAPTNIVAGRVYADSLTSTGMAAGGRTNVPTSRAHFMPGISSTVTVQEVTPQSAWGARSFEFVVTDAEGNVHPYAKIAAVEFHSTQQGSGTTLLHGFGPAANGPVLYHNVVGQQGQAYNIIQNAGNRVGQPLVTFGADGHSVSLTNLSPGGANPQNARMTLVATFFISADVNFEGPVYITLANRFNENASGGASEVLPSPTLRVANVTRQLQIESTVTNVNIGFQTIPVSSISLVETVAGRLRAGRDIQIQLSEFGVAASRTDMGFNPIVPAQVTVEGTTAVNSRVGVTLLPHGGAGNPVVRMSVHRTSQTAGSRITISNPTIYVNHSVPFGHYDVVARGHAVLDNDQAQLNPSVVAGGGNQIDWANPSQPGHRRYGFGGLRFDRYVNVVTPGQGIIPGQATARIEIPHTPGSTITVAGESVTLRNAAGDVVTTENINGRLFVPLRAVTEALGAQVTFIQGNPASGIAHVVVVQLNGVTAEWRIGENTYIVNGATRPMFTGGIETRPFISESGANAGSTYLPIRYIAQAFGLPLADNVNNNAVINATPAEVAGAAQ